MAEIYTDEGLDYKAGIFPKNGTNIATLYLGLFTSQTASTVPARTATGGAVPAGWAEAAGTGYARQAIAAASWGAPSTNGNGRKITAGQVTFSTVGAGINWGTANGFFIATLSASGAGDVIICFSNFDAGIARALVEGVTEKVTPSMQFDG
jgi:hypothetical protein